MEYWLLFLMENYYKSERKKKLNEQDQNSCLGSCVDEERSQLRELMWIAGHIEHRSWTHIAASGNSRSHACLRVGQTFIAKKD